MTASILLSFADATWPADVRRLERFVAEQSTEADARVQKERAQRLRPGPPLALRAGLRAIPNRPGSGWGFWPRWWRM